MSGSNGKVPTTTGVSTLVRPRFEAGMLLQHDDLEQLTAYTRGLSRLLFRSFFGCGVVCGLKVDVEEKCGKVTVIVRSGLALDCAGDPLYVPKDQRIVIDEDCEGNVDPPLWVVLCGTTKRCGTRVSMCGCEEEDASQVSTREREGFELRVHDERPECICGCKGEAPPKDGETKEEDPCACVEPEHECYQDHYDGKCACHCGDCSDCDCKCVLLARLYQKDTAKEGEDPKLTWTADHTVRRFIRPLLMRDPMIAAPPPSDGTTDVDEAIEGFKKLEVKREAPKPGVSPKAVKGGRKAQPDT